MLISNFCLTRTSIVIPESTSLSEYLEGLHLTDMEDDDLEKHLDTARIMKTKIGLEAIFKGLDAYIEVIDVFGDLFIEE